MKKEDDNNRNDLYDNIGCLWAGLGIMFIMFGCAALGWVNHH